MKTYILEFDTLRMTFVKLNKFELLRSIKMLLHVFEKFLKFKTFIKK
jgi:hypothetical protein